MLTTPLMVFSAARVKSLSVAGCEATRRNAPDADAPGVVFGVTTDGDGLSLKARMASTVAAELATAIPHARSVILP